jgi:sodium transport system permease protein
MSLRNIGVVYRKELVDSLRDRRTIVSMLVIPILLFPALTIGMGLLGAKLMSQAKEEIPDVMVVGGEDSPLVVAALHESKKIHAIPATADYATRISDRTLRAAVEIPPDLDAAAGRGELQTVKIDYHEGDVKSELTKETISKMLSDYRDDFAAQLLSARNLPKSLVRPFKIDENNVAPPEKVSGSGFGGLIPYFVIILSFTGAMYPAMDLTAGEKERGTMETILTSPISRTDLVLGKFFMVFTASIATAVFSLSSMGISFSLSRQTLDRLLSEKEHAFHFALDPRGVLAVFVMIIPLAMLFSAMMLAISLFAKSFREAQTYLSPLTFVVIMPAIIALLPGIELNTQTALIPILSTTLVGKELMTGTHPWGYIALIFLSSCVYAAVAIGAAVTMFNRESVLFRA